MGFATYANTIRTHFNDQWTETDIQVLWDNVKCDPPNDKTFVRLTILDADSNIAGIGGNKNLYRSVGIVVVGVFVPLGGGDGLAREIADMVANVFRNKSVDSVLFRAPRIKSIGNDGHGYWQINVKIPFQYDQFI